MSECELKYENDAIFKENYTQILFIAFGLRGNLDFPDFLQKKFYKMNYLLVVFSFIFCSDFIPLSWESNHR